MCQLLKPIKMIKTIGFLIRYHCTLLLNCRIWKNLLFYLIGLFEKKPHSDSTGFLQLSLYWPSSALFALSKKVLNFKLISFDLIPITLNTFIVFHTSLFTDNTCTLNTFIGTVYTGWVTQTPSCRITEFIRGTGTTFVT